MKVLFQASNVFNEGCVFKHNVYHLDENGYAPLPVTAMSTENDKCKIFLFNGVGNFYFVKKIWMTPTSNGTLKIFSGIEEELIAEVNTSSINAWDDVSASLFTLEIPTSTAVMINLSPPLCNIVETPICNPTFINVSRYPYFSTNYIGSKNYCINVTYVIDKFDVMFTVADIDITSSNDFYFVVNETQYSITKTFHSKRFSSGTVEFVCNCNSIERCKIKMSVETIDNEIFPSTALSALTSSEATSTFKISTTSTEKSNALNFHLNSCLIFVAFIILRIVDTNL